MSKAVKPGQEVTYLANLSKGPILLTAPHSCFVKRVLDGRDVQHLREHYASTIVLQLAKAIEDLQS